MVSIFKHIYVTKYNSSEWLKDNFSRKFNEGSATVHANFALKLSYITCLVVWWKLRCELRSISMPDVTNGFLLFSNVQLGI